MAILGSILEFIKTVVIIVIVAFLVRFYLIQPFIVDGSSMEPNFHNGQYLLVDKLSYRFREPVRGDVIVFHPPTSPNLNYIKRIIALPGDEIQINNGQITVNGVKVDEPYINPEDRGVVRGNLNSNLKQVLGSNDYFVLGDNRDHSSDSREWGKLPKENFIGRAWLVVFPITDFGLVQHPSYAGISQSAQAAR